MKAFLVHIRVVGLESDSGVADHDIDATELRSRFDEGVHLGTTSDIGPADRDATPSASTSWSSAPLPLAGSP